MSGIPSKYSSFVTFPGVIVYQYVRYLFCKSAKIKVYKVCLFDFKNLYGYVQHEGLKKPYQGFIITIGPFLVNSLLAALISIPASFESNQLFFKGATLILKWLSISIAANAFPNLNDGMKVCELTWSTKNALISKILSIPFFAFVYIITLGSVYWLDLIYGVALTIFFPVIIGVAPFPNRI